MIQPAVEVFGAWIIEMQDDHIENTFVFERRKSRSGASCLHSIFRYYGGEIPSVFIRIMSGTNRHGTTLIKLFYAAFNLGFDVAVFEVNQRFKFDHVNLPGVVQVILENRKRHYLIVYEISKNELKIGDPFNGIVKMTFEEWEDKYNLAAFLQIHKNSTIPIGVSCAILAIKWIQKTIFNLVSWVR